MNPGRRQRSPKRELHFIYNYLLTASNDFCKLNLVIPINPEHIKYVSSYLTSSNVNVYSRFLQHYVTCVISTTNGSCIFSIDRSENIKSRTELNPGHGPETEDFPGKCRTVDHLSLYTPLWLHVECDTKHFKNHER